MATIAENLLELNQTKENFKTAFAEKEVDLTGVPFTEYPNKFAEIKTSEDLDTELTEQETLLGKLEEDVNALSDKDDTALKILNGTLEEFDNKQWGLTSLRPYGFDNFSSLKKINLTGITEIPQNAFYRCKNVEDVVIDPNTSKVDYDGLYYVGNAVSNSSFVFEPSVDCELKDNALSYSGVVSIKGVFVRLYANSIYQCGKLKNVDIDIRQANNANILSWCPNIQSLKLNFDNFTGSRIPQYFACHCGGERPNPENNVFVVDMRKTQITTVDGYAFSGDSNSRNRYFRCFFPKTLTKIESYVFRHSDNCVTYFAGTTPATLGSYFFQNSSGYKIFVPYNAISAYKVATNWTTKADYIYGWAEENTFEQGATLPTTNDEGLTLTWYSDENMTTQVTSVDDASKIYYCVGV